MSRPRERRLCVERGAALDVYVGEFERPPMAQLWSDRRVLITPHVSNGTRWRPALRSGLAIGDLASAWHG